MDTVGASDDQSCMKVVSRVSSGQILILNKEFYVVITHTHKAGFGLRNLELENTYSVWSLVMIRA